MPERFDVVVIGAGPAGLAMSHELRVAGVDHVVLERGRIGQAWRDRWDSFRLVTPNWTVQLPGGTYDGDDPDGFMPRDALVAHFEGYAAGFGAPVREGVEVTSLEADAGDGFALRTPAGELRADRVVVASGTYRRPHRPAGAEGLPADLLVIDLEDYRSAAALPDGAILVVGSGQSGCQVAEELTEAGRDVFLACGRAPWTRRRTGGRDLVWWGIETGFADQGLADLPHPAARLFANVLASGHRGGHDLHLRTLRADGVTLLGHFAGVEGRTAHFAPDLAETIAWGDERYRWFDDDVRRLVTERGWPMPDLPEPEPFDPAAPDRLDLDGVGAVLFAGGFRPDYASWIRVPDAFDELGFPVQVDGASTAAPGLFFVGTHFLRKRKSATLFGMGEDAAVVAGQIARAG